MDKRASKRPCMQDDKKARRRTQFTLTKLAEHSMEAPFTSQIARKCACFLRLLSAPQSSSNSKTSAPVLSIEFCYTAYCSVPEVRNWPKSPVATPSVAEVELAATPRSSSLVCHPQRAIVDRELQFCGQIWFFAVWYGRAASRFVSGCGRNALHSLPQAYQPCNHPRTPLRLFPLALSCLTASK